MTPVLRHRIVDAAFTVALTGLALVGFRTVFGGFDFLLAGAIGIAVAIVAAAVTARQPVFVTAGVVVVVTVWSGAVLVFPHDTIAGVLPTAAGIREFTNSAVHGWRDLVTTLPPVAGRDLLAVPLLSACAATLIAVTLSWRTRAVALPLIGPGAMLAAVILLGTDVSASIIACGAAFAVIALAWAAMRHRRSVAVTSAAAEVHTDRPSAGGSRSAVRAGAVLAVAALGTVLVSLIPMGSSRYVLRDHVQPPFDVSAYPSPLSSYRRFEVTDKNSVLFTVSGMPAGARIRLAVMDSYDGVVWGVAGGANSTKASGVFQRVGEPIPATSTGPRATVTVTAGSLGGVWLPTVGQLTSVTFAGPRAADLNDSFRYNLTTGVGVVPAGLGSSDRYTMTAIVPPVENIATLGDNASGSATQPDLSGVPDAVAAKAGSWTEGRTGPIARLEAIVSQMHNGAFSDGTVNSNVVSAPGAGERRIETFLNAQQLVGDGEQYAATLALMARNLGIPARVVLGVVPPAIGFDGRVTGKMVSAWVEVDIAGAGWVPLDPTPPVTNKPQPQQTLNQPNIYTKAIAPPIVAAQATDQQPGDNPGSNPPPRSQSVSRWLQRLLAIGIDGGFEVLGLAALGIAVISLKRQRRRRRRGRGTPLEQIAAGWNHLTDQLHDLGIAMPATGTRRQQAYRTGFPQVESLAHRVDEAVFAPGEPDAATADALWHDIDVVLGRLRGTRTALRRLRATLDPTTLRPPKPAWLRLPTSTIAAQLQRIPSARRPATEGPS